MKISRRFISLSFVSRVAVRAGQYRMTIAICQPQEPQVQHCRWSEGRRRLGLDRFPKEIEPPEPRIHLELKLAAAPMVEHQPGQTGKQVQDHGDAQHPQTRRASPHNMRAQRRQPDPDQYQGYQLPAVLEMLAQNQAGARPPPNPIPPSLLPLTAQTILTSHLPLGAGAVGLAEHRLDFLSKTLHF